MPSSQCPALIKLRYIIIYSSCSSNVPNSTTKFFLEDGVNSICHLLTLPSKLDLQRTMGRTYQENLTNQQRLEGGSGLRDELNKTYGEPAEDHWQTVLVRNRYTFLALLSN